MNYYLNLKVSSTSRLAIILLSLTIGVASFFAYRSYQAALESYIEQAKAKLQTAAMLLIPYQDEWHDRFLSDNMPSEEEYYILVRKQAKLAKEINVNYIYTFTYTLPPKFYFSSGSDSEEDFKKPELLTKLGQEYENKSEYLEKVALTKTPQFGQAQDKWGHHFSYMIPRVSPKGVAYIIGIDLSVDTIKENALKIFWYWLIVGSFISTIGFIFAFFAIKPIMRELNEKNNALELQTQNLKIANAQLEYLAKKDSLTGVNNRREFFTLVAKIWDRYEDIFCVMLDLDKFKTINDTFGHTWGDSALVEFTKTVTLQLDQESIFGRMGGEEFALILFNKSYEQIETVLESIRHNTQNLQIYVNNQTIQFTVSMGIAKKNNNDSIDECLDQADLMLYEVKQSGRNQIKFRESISKEKP